MKKLLYILSIPALLLIGISTYRYCTERHFSVDKEIANTKLPFDIIELNKELNSENIEEVFNKYPKLATFYYGEKSKDKKVVINQFKSMYANTEFQDLCTDVNKEFADINFIRDELSYAFKTIKYNYDYFKIPTVYFIVNGFGTDLYVGEDIIVVALEYFLTDKSKWKSKQPSYIAETFTPQSISTKIILEVLERFLKFDNENKTMLNHMLKIGRIAYFAKAALPNVPEEIILEYTHGNYVYLNEIENVIWQYLTTNQLIYSDSYIAIRSFVGKAPFTQEITMKCPGNVGGFIGYKIIKSYMNNTDSEIKELLENYDIQYFFNKSKYNPLQK